MRHRNSKSQFEHGMQAAGVAGAFKGGGSYMADTIQVEVDRLWEKVQAGKSAEEMLERTTHCSTSVAILTSGSDFRAILKFSIIIK